MIVLLLLLSVFDFCLAFHVVHVFHFPLGKVFAFNYVFPFPFWDRDLKIVSLRCIKLGLHKKGIRYQSIQF